MRKPKEKYEILEKDNDRRFFDVVKVERCDDEKDSGIAINIAAVVQIDTGNGLMPEIRTMPENIVEQIVITSRVDQWLPLIAEH